MSEDFQYYCYKPHKVGVKITLPDFEPLPPEALEWAKRRFESYVDMECFVATSKIPVVAKYLQRLEYDNIALRTKCAEPWRWIIWPRIKAFFLAFVPEKSSTRKEDLTNKGE